MPTPEHFDAVIVGSGFGGSVMAYRLAEAGLRVCLLERGKPYPPGSFPRSPYRMQSNFWDPSQGYHGLFNIWSFKHIEVIVSSGLGGGSLIYANVLLRKDEKWFVTEERRDGPYEYWPITRAELDPHYDAVEWMLRPERYPIAHQPYANTPRTIAFQNAARMIGLTPELPKLAISFRSRPDCAPIPGVALDEPPERNLHNAQRSTCRLCAECDIGCNYGSKNTLDYTYLSAAQRLGAQIRALHEVRGFRPLPRGGYAIEYVVHHPDPEREGQAGQTRRLPIRAITADQLILSAGALGSTFLMLKMWQCQPGFKRVTLPIGTRFSGNGDLLTFARKCSDSTNGRRMPRVIDPGYGPAITSAVRVGAEQGVERGFYIEDAGLPEFINWLVQSGDLPNVLRRVALTGGLRRLNQLRGRFDSDLSAEFADLFGICEASNGLLPLLGMGRDIPDGTMELRTGISGKPMLDINWHKNRSSAYFTRVQETMEQLAKALGGSLLTNPLSHFNRLITVHPLGGCPMGRDEREGVVDSYGEVFGVPGLFIADGAVMPGPVGPNPSLTIAAMADRFAERVIANHCRRTRVASNGRAAAVGQETAERALS